MSYEDEEGPWRKRIAQKIKETERVRMKDTDGRDEVVIEKILET